MSSVAPRNFSCAKKRKPILQRAVIQAIMTLSLHCAKLLVNMICDERSWRDVSKGGHRWSWWRPVGSTAMLNGLS
jgi:enterochelin esterase-like enzyme